MVSICLSNVNKMTIKIDKKDELIINELIQNAKIPLRKLATKLDVSFVTVMNRTKRLENAGIIRGYSANIDYSKLGYDIHVIIEVRIAEGKLLELEKKIAQSKNIYAVYDATGEFDATIIGRFTSTRTMDSFVKKICALDFVDRTNTKLVLNTIKEDNMLL